jgi:sulfoxide reductase heme-binding subunit YedZ
MNQRLITPYLLWVLLAAPGVVLLGRYLAGVSFYGEVVHLSGRWAVYTLFMAMAVSPVRLLWPARAWSAWLLRSRRAFGVASFTYAALHTAVYLQRKSDMHRVLSEAQDPGLATGWLALALFLPLALTSNDFSVRWLRRGWKRLHRLVYPAAFLVMAHWLLTAFDPTRAVVFLALLVAMLVLRVVLVLWKKSGGSAPAPR